jgi:hypothetical protein
MKKVIKIKESAVLDIIGKIILEQATAVATKEVPASGEIGTTPTYDGLKTLLKTLKTNVEKELRGGTPFKVKNGGVKFGRSGNSLTVSVSLEQCVEEQRYWYFDVAGAVFSYATDDTSLRSALDNKLIDKARYFGGIANNKKHLLKTNFIDLSALKGIDPKEPEKAFKLLVGYVVGEMPEGVQALAGEDPIAKVQDTAAVAPEKTVAAPKPEAETVPKTNTTQQNAGVTKTLSGSFETADGDSAHNFKELETKIGAALSEMYKAGTNPKIKSVTAKIINNKGIFSTSYSAEIGPSDDGKAWMGFTARGSFGTDYKKRADGQISGSENRDGRSLEEKLKGIGAGEVAVIGQPYVDTTTQVKEYFVQFTKPKDFPPHQ